MVEGQIVGKYRVVARIGRGGMGTVYRAVDEILQRDVAIKVLNPELNEAEVARRFRAEAVTVARLSHPGIATVYELFQHEDRWLMAMEYVRGETLEELIERTGALPVDRIVDIASQTLAALAHAHHVGVVHRDLKPANLMLNESGVVKIMDFGIARVMGSEHLTTTGLTMGTPAYMAPEQLLGHDVDVRADLYAMGVVLYRMATGKLPFKGDTPFAMAQSQVSDPPPLVRLTREELPSWIEQVITRALAKRPADRFQTAESFAVAIRNRDAGMPMDSAAADPPASAESTPEAQTSAPFLTRWTLRHALVLLVLLALGSAAAVLIFRPSPPPPVVAESSVPSDVPLASEPPSAAPTPSDVPASPSARGVPAAVPKSQAAPSAPPAPRATGRRVGGAAADPLLTFSKVKWLTVNAENGRDTKDQDVVLNFAAGRISLVPKAGGEALQVVPYQQISHATYVNGRKPEWNPSAPSPSEDLRVRGGFLGFGGGARQWLTLQTATSFVILRLDENPRAVLEAVETRTGLKVDIRP